MRRFRALDNEGWSIDTPPSSSCPVTVYGPDRVPAAADNRFSRLIPTQNIAVVSEFQLESGVVLRDVSVGFRTWGKLNDKFRCPVSLSLFVESHVLTLSFGIGGTMSW